MHLGQLDPLLGVRKKVWLADPRPHPYVGIGNYSGVETESGRGVQFLVMAALVVGAAWWLTRKPKKRRDPWAPVHPREWHPDYGGPRED